jgi:hypothetical protein
MLEETQGGWESVRGRSWDDVQCEVGGGLKFTSKI